MNKRKRTGRIALALLISGIVFLTNTIAMLLTIVAIYGLARLGVIETTGGQVGLPELLRFFFYTSLVIGFLLASLTGKIILKPIKRIIDQLDRLASGDETAFRQAYCRPSHLQAGRKKFQSGGRRTGLHRNAAQ